VFSGEDVVLVATDELTDLAVIRVNAEGLDAVEFGDSDLVNIGDWVIAVGNPLQLAHTVTQGIVSSKYRETSQGMIVDFLQTSAHIEPGSSGGALLNLRGELVGINTAIATEGDRWEGFGFALPSNTVHTVVDSLIEKGHVPRGYIGIRFPNAGGGLSESARRLLGYRGPGGVLIQGVESSGPSDFAGIQPDDILVTLAGQPIATGLDMLRTVASLPVGSIAEVELWRGDRRTSTGRFVTADLAIAARPSDDELRLRDRRVPPEPSDEPVTLGRTGLSVNITGPLSDRQIMVTGVDPNTPADQLGFQVGDRIVRVNGWRVGTEWGLYDALRLQPAHIADHEFLIRRGDIDRRLVMSVEEAGLEPAPDIAEPPPPARGAPREQTD
jgi:serine protease Do/serine protease DegQ